MKKILSSTYYLFFLAAFAALAGGMQSCKKNDTTAAPVVTRVRTIATTDASGKPVALDSTVNAVIPGNQYAIIGDHLATTYKVTFNGAEATLNPAMITDNTIILQVPANTPFTSSELMVSTQYGTVTFKMGVLQPAPVITDVSQMNGVAGDRVTISGTAFDNVSSVKFGNAVASVVSASATKIVVTVPQNALGSITVTTPGGTAAGPYTSYDNITLPVLVPFGLKSVVYDEAIVAGWQWGWSYDVDPASTAVVKRGTYSIKQTYNGAYSGLMIGANSVNMSDYSYVKFSIYGTTGTEGKVIKVAVNDFDHLGVSVLLHAGVWSTYVIPITAFQDASGSPASFNSVGFQELSGNAPETIYLDDIGLY